MSARVDLGRSIRHRMTPVTRYIQSQLNADNVTKPLVAFQAQVSLHAPDGKDVSDLGANTSEQG